MIEKFIDIPIVYKRRVGSYGAGNYVLMDEFKQFLKENELFNNDSVLVGIALDNPLEIGSEDCRYDVGIVVENLEIESKFPKRFLDNGSYLIIEVEHTSEAVSQFWQNLPNHVVDYKLDPKRPIIERYAVSKVNQGYCEFCIPVCL